MVTNSTRDRAQVILIGAIVIAFVILGVVVVLNGLVHTEEMSSSSTAQSVGHAETTHTELTSSVQRMIAEEYDDEYQVDDEDALKDNITAYLVAQNELQTNTSPSDINIKDITVESDVDKIALAKHNELGPGKNGNSINISGDVHKFIYEGERGVADDPTVTIENEYGQEHKIEIEQTAKYVNVTYDGVNDSYEDDVTIDFVTGEINGSDASSNPGIENIPGDIREIRFDAERGMGNEVGEYEIVGENITVSAVDLDGVILSNIHISYNSDNIKKEQNVTVSGFNRNHEI